MEAQRTHHDKSADFRLAPSPVRSSAVCWWPTRAFSFQDLQIWKNITMNSLFSARQA